MTCPKCGRDVTITPKGKIRAHDPRPLHHPERKLVRRRCLLSNTLASQVGPDAVRPVSGW